MPYLILGLLLVSQLGVEWLLPLKKLAHSFNQACVAFSETRNLHIYKALICAERSYSSTDFYALSARIGLAHWFVISGLHLNFIEIFLKKLRKKLTPVYGALFLYALLTGLHPPVLRAFVSISLGNICQRLQLGWTRDIQILITGQICLLLNPSLYMSLSLLLSWAAALSLSFFKNEYLKHVSVYFFLFPFLSSLYISHPLSILINILFTPIFIFILFPFTVLSFFIPPLQGAYEMLWFSVEALIQKIYLSLPPSSFVLPQFSTKTLWLLLISTHFLIFFMKRIRKVLILKHVA